MTQPIEMSDRAMCDRAWRSDEYTADPDNYRQHRCGKVAHPAGGHQCRYCGQPRNAYGGV